VSYAAAESSLPPDELKRATTVWAPDCSSLAWRCTLTPAGPSAVSIVPGSTEHALIFGGVTSSCPVCVIVDGSPSAAICEEDIDS
jgi:hypothetical protein